MFRRRGDKIAVAVGRNEAEVLRELIGRYRGLLHSEAIPGDPVLARLFPSASLDDADIDSQYRELSFDDLQRHKEQTARVAEQCLGRSGPWRAILTDEERDAWVVLLTDLRLTVGVRLGVTEQTYEAPLNPTDPDHWPLAILHYLGALQESLVGALLQGGTKAVL